jgi:alginate O-acetyltransferase complex protein AlgI
MFDVASFGRGVHWISVRAVLCLPVIGAFHALSGTRWAGVVELPAHRWYTPVILFTMIYLVLLYHPTQFTPFIYFQF